MARPGTLLLVAAIACATLALAAPAHAIQLGPEEPHSPNAESISTAYWVMIAVAIALLIAVHVALVGLVLRFRERRGRRATRLEAGRGALRPVLAALGVLAAAVFVFGLVITGQARELEASGPAGLGSDQTAQVGVKGLPPASALESEQAAGGEATGAAPLEIDAIAQQWLWRFEYPGGQAGQRIFSYGELVVPVDTAVVLNIDSTDVIHSWWVPALGGQVQASPGEVVQTWFKADQEGVYPGRSTIFSGSAFPVMRGWVRVVSAPAYEDHVRRLEQDLRKAQGIVQRAQEEEVSAP